MVRALAMSTKPPSVTTAGGPGSTCIARSPTLFLRVEAERTGRVVKACFDQPLVFYGDS